MKRRTLPTFDLLHVGEVMHYLDLSRRQVLEHAILGRLRLSYDGTMVHRGSVLDLERQLKLERRGVVRPT